MESREYWKHRFELLQQSSENKGQRYVYDVEKEYKRATTQIQKELEIWYSRLAKNNGISLFEAKQILNSKQLEEFKWEVDKYIEVGKKTTVNPIWTKKLENASARVHISKLEAMQIQLQQQVEILYGNQHDGFDKLIRTTYTDSYYHSIFEIQKGFNIGFEIQTLDTKRITNVISKPWLPDDITFSDRVWKNKNLLINQLHTILTQSIIRGDSPDKTIQTVSKKLGTSKSRAGRLIMTESAYFSSIGQKDAFNELDVEQFEIVATLDFNTSKLCQDLDGKIIDMKNYEVGITAPPFHPWCRTTTVPYFSDNFGERFARGVDGKVYYIPSNIKYPNWYEEYVK